MLSILASEVILSGKKISQSPDSLDGVWIDFGHESLSFNLKDQEEDACMDVSYSRIRQFSIEGDDASLGQILRISLESSDSPIEFFVKTENQREDLLHTIVQTLPVQDDFHMLVSGAGLHRLQSHLFAACIPPSSAYIRDRLGPNYRQCIH